MTSADLICRFEAGEIDPHSFHHADHVRLAFEYLCSYPPLEALSRFCRALKEFAAAQGKANLYHETITCAYLFLIRERMARAGQTLSWEQFAAQNPDLLVWKDGILDQLYRPETLKTELARHTFVLPDRTR